MTPAFLRYSWGLVLVLLDLRIQYFDILVDFIGYALIMSAIKQLARFRSGYGKGLVWAWLLLILSLQEIVPVLGEPVAITGQPAIPTIPLLLYGALVMLLTWIMVHQLLTEMLQHARDVRRRHFAHAIENRRLAYGFVSAAALLYMPFTLNGTETVNVLLPLLLTFSGLLAQIVIIFTCRRAANELRLPVLPEPPDSDHVPS